MALFGAALAWIVGIGVGIVRSEAEALLGGALLLFAAALVAPGGSRLRRLSLLSGLLLLGACRAASGSAADSISALHPLRDRLVELSGRVDEPPRCGPKSCRFLLEVERLFADGSESPLAGRVQVTTAARSDLRVGRTVVARGTLHAPRVTWGAPHADLLARRGVHETLDYPWLRVGPAIDLAPHQRFQQLRGAPGAASRRDYWWRGRGAHGRPSARSGRPVLRRSLMICGNRDRPHFSGVGVQRRHCRNGRAWLRPPVAGAAVWSRCRTGGRHGLHYAGRRSALGAPGSAHVWPRRSGASGRAPGRRSD